MNKLKVFVAYLFAAFGVFAQVEEDVLVTTGIASTFRGAVDEALISALEQHDGILVSSTEVSALSSSSSGVSTTTGGLQSEASRHETYDAIAKAMKKWANGKISSYAVISEKFDDITDLYSVEVEVRFPAKYKVGRDPNNLRRMVVGTFNVRNRNFRWNGQVVDSIDWVMELGNRLNADLTQTRKFTMLDRAYDPAVNAELARLSEPGIAPSEAVRLNQKLGTDYLVVGEVSFGDVLPPETNPFTGRPVPQTSSLFADIHYRVLLAPTGQLKWSDSVRIDAADFQAGDPRSFVAMTTEAAAAEICSGVMNNILPFEVVAVNAGMLVIGEGGKQLSAGQRFSVNVLGDEVCDTRTGEVIDVVEIPVATAEIVSVQPKLSYAKVIEGDASLVKVGARLRPVQVVESAVEPAPTPATIRVNANGGVVLPF